MALRIVIFGPGRVGTACAMRLVRSGTAEFLGFVGRDAGRTAAAVAAAGAGRSLRASEHAAANVVLFAVPDHELRAAIAAAAQAAPPRAGCSWVHTSGRFGLEVFDGVPGIRRGALHPAAPFADAAHGAAAMSGAPGVFVGDDDARAQLRELCAALGLAPIEARAGDRVLYHAACALAANGLTALFDAAAQAFAASGVLGEDPARAVTAALMQAAVAGSAAQGPGPALSGPVRRGDAETVAAHIAALRARAPAVLPVYLATARLALELAAAAGVDPARVRALRELLGA